MTRLPRLTGRDLTGAARTLPDDVAGRPALLLVGFAEQHQGFVDAWSAALHEADLPDDVPLLEVPVASPRQQVFARFIEGGMVPGVATALHASTIVVYTDIAALLAALGLPAPLPALVALDERGDVTIVHAVPPDAETAATIVGLVDRSTRP